jgi:hypothetical protein
MSASNIEVYKNKFVGKYYVNEGDVVTDEMKQNGVSAGFFGLILDLAFFIIGSFDVLRRSRTVTLMLTVLGCSVLIRSQQEIFALIVST